MSEDKKVSKPSYEDFYQGAAPDDTESDIGWAWVLRAILQGIKR